MEKEFCDEFGYFYREPYFIISQEFKELKTYFSILNAIASSRTKPTEIAHFVGIESRTIYPYLENLIRLGFVERKVSLLGNPKKGVYFIKDHIFDLWFNFVVKHRVEIERGVFRLDEEELSRYMGRKFEVLVEQELAPLLLPDYFSTGKWWHRDEKIDVVEVKWGRADKRKADGIIAGLKRKAGLVEWTGGMKYGIIGKRIEGKEGLRREGYLAFDLDNVENILAG